MGALRGTRNISSVGSAAAPGHPPKAAVGRGGHDRSRVRRRKVSGSVGRAVATRVVPYRWFHRSRTAMRCRRSQCHREVRWHRRADLGGGRAGPSEPATRVVGPGNPIFLGRILAAPGGEPEAGRRFSSIEFLWRRRPTRGSRSGNVKREGRPARKHQRGRRRGRGDAIRRPVGHRPKNLLAVSRFGIPRVPGVGTNNPRSAPPPSQRSYSSQVVVRSATRRAEDRPATGVAAAHVDAARRIGRSDEDRTGYRRPVAHWQTRLFSRRTTSRARTEPRFAELAEKTHRPRETDTPARPRSRD